MAKNSFQSNENHNDSKSIIKTKKEIKEELNIVPPVLTKLKKLFLLNKKNPRKINDNLFKILIDSDLIIQAYDKIQRNKGSHTFWN